MLDWAGKVRAWRALALASVIVLGSAASASATTLDFSAASGSLSADALFSLTGSTLTVTLTNTSTADVLVPADVLTALFFSLDNGASLTAVSAVLGSGSSVVYWNAGGDVNATQTGPNTGTYAGDVSAEWAYLNGTGISSSGLGLFGPSNRFDTTRNLYGPADPDGLQFGLLSAGDNAGTGNNGVTGAPLVNDSVVFTLTASNGFTLDDILGVSFQYGTALTEPNIVPHTPVVPEPTSMCLLGIGIAGMVARKIRNRVSA